MACNSTIINACLQEIETAIINFDNNSIFDIKEPLISNQVKQILEICIQVVLFMTTSLFGFVANMINIIVYWKQGLKDSITLGFFALSISDLFVVVMSIHIASCYAAKTLLPHSNIDFPSIFYVSSGSFRTMFYSISCILTSFLSLERCCCVVHPFKVKSIFTRSRTTVTLVAILVVHVICYIPYLTSQKLRWKAYPSVNGTQTYKLRVQFFHYRPIVERFIYIVMVIISPTISQIIVTVCAVILTNRLRASSKFRKVMQSTVAVTETRSDTGKSINRNMATLSNRDARLVKVMVFLVAIMSMSNVPLLMITYALNFVPDLNIGQSYQNTFSTSFGIAYVLGSLGASLNIFVYYRTSTKYKEVCDSLFKRSKNNGI